MVKEDCTREGVALTEYWGNTRGEERGMPDSDMRAGHFPLP